VNATASVIAFDFLHRIRMSGPFLGEKFLLHNRAAQRLFGQFAVTEVNSQIGLHSVLARGVEKSNVLS